MGVKSQRAVFNILLRRTKPKICDEHPQLVAPGRSRGAPRCATWRPKRVAWVDWHLPKAGAHGPWRGVFGVPTTRVALMPLSTTLGWRKLRIPPKTRSYKAMVTKLPIDSGQSSIAHNRLRPVCRGFAGFARGWRLSIPGGPGRSQNRPMFQGVEGPAAGVIDRQLVTAL